MRDRVAVPAGIVEQVRVPRVEVPTLLLALAIYGGWLALTWYSAVLPIWITLPGLAWLVAWHGSLQHEVLHGHPTRIRAVNDAIGFPPLALWLPYQLYRASHLRHHDDWRLTDPLDDPESRYWTDEQWTRLSRAGRWLVQAQSTFLGRLVLGPGWSVGRFFYFQARALSQDLPGAWRIWGPHFAGVFFVLAWVSAICGMHPLLYIFGAVYPGVSLALIRSFAEHRAAPGVRERIAIVERSPLFGLLFLYNNLHLVHHAWPQLPWYGIPGLYRRHRDTLVRANGGLVYRGYLDVARRFWLTPHDRVLHPLGRAPTDEAAA